MSAVVSFVAAVLTAFLVVGLVGDFSNLSSLVEKDGTSESEKETNQQEAALSYEQKIIDLVKKNAPAVVNIIVTKDLPVIERHYDDYNSFGEEEFFRQFFGNDFFSPFDFSVPQYRQRGYEEKEVGGGTGFIVSSDGLILTNKHVVLDEEADYTVLTNEGEKIAAEVLARDPVEDIAILKIDKSNLPVIELGDSNNLKIGQTAIAIGNALGEFRNTVSVGVISGLRRSISAQGSLGQTEEFSEVIQTDAAINPGNSGGPLLDLEGKAIGINVAMAQGAQNIGFSLPIEKARRDIEQIKKEGKISYPFLGVRYILIDENIQENNNLSVDHGALVIRGEYPSETAVMPGSAADKAGIKENDIILEVNGEKITKENTLAELIHQYQVGEKITLKIQRQGEEKALDVVLGERE